MATLKRKWNQRQSHEFIAASASLDNVGNNAVLRSLLRPSKSEIPKGRFSIPKPSQYLQMILIVKFAFRLLGLYSLPEPIRVDLLSINVSINIIL